jgi:hypothetical protein
MPRFIESLVGDYNQAVTVLIGVASNFYRECYPSAFLKPTKNSSGDIYNKITSQNHLLAQSNLKGLQIATKTRKDNAQQHTASPQ